MRIAICFSGMIRTGPQAAPNILRFIDTLLPNVDFFLHTWDISQDKIWNLHSQAMHDKQLQNRPVPPIKSSYPLLASMVHNYGKEFKKIKIDHYHDTSIFSKSPIPLWYSWHESIKLKQQYEQENNFTYDVVVKLRPDIIFDDHKLKDAIDNFDKDYFMCINGNTTVLNDVYFVANSSIMDIASECWKKMIHNNSINGTELGLFLKSNNINTRILELYDVTKIYNYAIYREECVLAGISPLDWENCHTMEEYYYAEKNEKSYKTLGI